MGIRKSLSPIILLALLVVSVDSITADEAPPPPKTATVTAYAPVVLIDQSTGKGSEQLTLRNKSDKEISLVLRAEFGAADKASVATIKFGPADDITKGVSQYSMAIKGGETVTVLVAVNDLWNAGDVDAELFNGGETLNAKLKIRRLPFDVKLDESNPENAKLSLVHGTPITIAVKNDDGVAYSLTWKLLINGESMCKEATVTLNPNSVGLLQCTPSVCDDSNWLNPCWISRAPDWFKPHDSEGLLLLYPKSGGAASAPASPLKKFPVTASVSYFRPLTQQVVGYLVILSLLTLGGVASLILSQALPNRLQRLNLKEQLDGIGAVIADFSSNVDSKLAVVLKIERKRLHNLLHSRISLSPEFADIAKQTADAAATLGKRVDLAQQLDVVVTRRERALSEVVIPTRVDETGRLLRKARNILIKNQPTEEALKIAEVAICQASDKIDAINQPDADFGAELKERVLTVKKDIDTNIKDKYPAFLEINENFPEAPYAVLESAAKDVDKITPAEYASLDWAVHRILVIKDYVRLRGKKEISEGFAEEKEEVDPQETKDDWLERLKRLKKREPKLLEHLRKETWVEMRSARLLLREMRDDVYPERLEDVLQDGGASIDMDPSIARDQSTLDFCIWFYNPVVDKAAARQEWKCVWDFGDGFTEEGWDVAHFFQLKRGIADKTREREPADSMRSNLGSRQNPYKVRATFFDAEGNQVPASKGSLEILSVDKDVVVEATKDSKILGERTRNEILKLAAALLIAVFGLVAGAKDQLLRLDVLPAFIAVFLLGFGADTIKNLLTTKS